MADFIPPPKDGRLEVALSVAKVSALVTVDPLKSSHTIPQGLFLCAFNDKKVGITDEQMAFFKSRLKGFLPEIAPTIDAIHEDSSQIIEDVARIVWLAEQGLSR